jgi:hypothetical protein
MTLTAVRRLARILLAWGALTLLLPSSGAAQSWELHLGRMSIDHEPPVPDAWGDRLPVGLAVSGRYVWSWGGSVEVEASHGTQTRPGSVCFGLVAEPSDCVLEPVEYSGGLTALLFGWRVAAGMGPDWSLGLRPRIGLGRVGVRERGDDTGRKAWQDVTTLVYGVSGDVRYDVPRSRLSLIASTGLDQLRPLGLERCSDCYDVLREPMPQWLATLGLAWAIW